MMEHSVAFEKKRKLHKQCMLLSLILYFEISCTLMIIISPPWWLKIVTLFTLLISPILIVQFSKSAITKERIFRLNWNNWSDSCDFMFAGRVAYRRSHFTITKISKIFFVLILTYFLYVDIFRFFTLPIACLHLGLIGLQIAILMRLLSLYKNYQIFFYKTRIVSHEAWIPAVIKMADIKKHQFIPTSNGRWLLEINTGVFYQCFDLDLEKKMCLEAVLELTN